MRHAVLAALLALCLSSESALATEAVAAPDDFLPDEAALPEGYELRAELMTRDDRGDIAERVYVNTATDGTLRLVAVAARSEAEARSACATAADRLRADDFDVQPALVAGVPGIVAERRMGLAFQRAAYVASGPACVGVMTMGEEDRVPGASAAPILRAMVTRIRAA